MSACVPNMISVCHDFSLSRASSFIRGVMDPTRRSDRIPSDMSQASLPAKCCRARISVGAIIATWTHDFLITCIAARRATTVFPVPTSPWRRRAMACGCSISFSIWKRTIFCLFVRGNGRPAMSSFMRSVSIGIATACHSLAASALYFFSRPRR